MAKPNPQKPKDDKPDPSPSAPPATHPPEPSTDEQVQKLRSEVAELKDALDQKETEVATLKMDLEAAKKTAAVDGPVFQSGRDEGRSDVAAMLRKILDPNDAQHWSLDGLLGEVRHARATALDGMRGFVPEEGWASARAKALVEAVPPHERALLLGDLLMQLAPHAGEGGANEAASDILRRKLRTAARAELTQKELLEKFQRGAEDRDELARELVRAQNALVARRAPGAGAEAALEHFGRMLEGPALALGFSSDVPLSMAAVLEQVLSEWVALRYLLGKQPMAAVAVRDDGNEQLAERYSLLLLEWDGKKLTPSVLERARPWFELVRLLRNTVETRLVPLPFR